MAKQSSKQSRIVGDVVAILLSKNTYGYALVLDEPLLSFFDFASNGMIDDVDLIINSPVLFQLWVMNSAITSGQWLKVGHVDVRSDVLVKPWFFKQDLISKKIFKTRDGNEEIPISLDEATSLECAAVWDSQHVVDRINDHIAGVPNKWVRSLQPK